MSDQIINTVRHFSVTIHHPSGGFSLDADNNPRIGVFEQDTDVAIYDGIMTKRGGFTGLYRGTVPVSGSEGFEIDKWYDVIVSGSVQNITSKFLFDNFRVVRTDTDDIETELTVVSGDVVSIKSQTDQFTFSSSGVKADVVAVSGVAIKTNDGIIDSNIVSVSGTDVQLSDFVANTDLLARQADLLATSGTAKFIKDMLTVTSGDVLSVKTKTDQLTFSSSGVKADTVAISGNAVNIEQLQGTSAGDWTTDEKSQIRDALGVDGTKIHAVGGYIQAISGDVSSIKSKTDQLTFSSSGVKSDVVAVSGSSVNINMFSGESGSGADWGETEKSQIRHALGIGGTKIQSVGGTLQAVSGDVSSIKAKTDQLTFSSSGIKADIIAVTGDKVSHISDFHADISNLALQSTLLETSGNVVDIKSQTDQFTFSSSGVKADIVATSGSAVNINMFSGEGGSGVDWSEDERKQIRDALGIDGTKINSVGGYIQAISGDVSSIKSKTDQLTFSSSGVKVDVVAVSGGSVEIHDFKADVSNVGVTGVVQANVVRVNDTEVGGTGNFQTDLSPLDIYHADIDFRVDGSGGRDEYTVYWLKNASRITTGITNPVIHVMKRTTGDSLISPTAMTEIGSTHVFKYDESSNLQKTGEAYLISASATIESETRNFLRILGRDNAASG